MRYFYQNNDHLKNRQMKMSHRIRALLKKRRNQLDARQANAQKEAKR